MTAVATLKSAGLRGWHRGWHSLGRWRRERLTRPAGVSLFLLLLTGLSLFDPLGVPWAAKRWLLLAHVALAVILVPLVLIPFWKAHRSRLRWSRRRFMRVTGRGLELGFAGLFASGGWLLFWGWNGTFSGAVLHWTHLVLALPLAVLVLAHGWRRLRLPRLRLRRAGGAVILTLITLGGTLGLARHAAAAGRAPAAVESRSLLAEPGEKTLLSANFEAGSVSRIERATGQRLAETTTGGNVTALALDPGDGLIAATDFTSGQVTLLRQKDLTVARRIALPAERTGGVVYDARNHLFWVAATEDDRLYGVTPGGKVQLTLDTAESPRGLALMADGRLLVSHSMIGAVSVYDTTSLPPKRAKLIRLAVEENPDQTVSQGLPRGLNRIVVSPDGKQAWLPHLLWNFDHPFQFQSTVFPAISVLSLKPGEEHEAVSRRKQLFRQINILEDGNRTRIVSNPADVAFSGDGTKAYVTMSGSEDLVVFDLSRALPIDSRKKAARTTDGAKAVQIYRHLPGQMPDGIVALGDDLYIQNRMGLDLTHATTGGSGPFAQLRILAPHFAHTVGQDPLPPALRRGTRLFFNANTSSFPDAPMAGDNWMSCSSCHVEGFNFTNRALFRATPVDKFHSSFTGHGSITSLVAGDFTGDYLRMIRNTQGGMGADTRFPAPDTDPAAPPEKVRAMMEDLHAYVTARGNLPLLATWLRAGDGGGHVDPKAWTSAAVCAACHSDLARQWSNSLHANSAGTDPYYVVLEDEAARNVGEGFRAWCRGCHAPQATLSGVTKTVAPYPLFTPQGRFAAPGMTTPEADLAQHAHAVEQGISCLSCHAVAKNEQAGASAGANASLNLAPGALPLYPFEASDSAILRAVGRRLIRARPETHAASLMQHLGGPESGKLCAACHEEFAPGNGAEIVSTWQEWEASPYNAPNDPAQNRTCVDCHMHAEVSKIGQDVAGRATDGGPLEANVATHRFTGAQYHLAGLRSARARAESVALLRRAATLSLSHDPGRGVVVRVANTGAGHDLPTGVSDFRQLWLQVTVTDATGRVVLRSGELDAAGNLDAGARIFHKVFGTEGGHVAGLDFWRLARFKTDTRIPAGGHRDEAFALPENTVYPVRAKARLMFRTFPQWVTDKVIARFPDMPAPAPVVTAEITQELK